MDKQIILAVAGAGKTYHICHSINPKKRSLILCGFAEEFVFFGKRDTPGQKRR